MCAQGEKDWQKYEVARRLKEEVETIRRRYRVDWKDREMKNRQRGVALYFIDKVLLCCVPDHDPDLRPQDVVAPPQIGSPDAYFMT